MPIARLFRSKESKSKRPSAIMAFDHSAPPRRGNQAREFVAADAPPLEADPLKLMWQQQRYALIAKSADEWRGPPEGPQLAGQGGGEAGNGRGGGWGKRGNSGGGGIVKKKKNS